jgi:hypothetical protein
MNNSCREDLKNYALRKLGHPALQINITSEQMDDRIDDALAIYWENHHEGNYLSYVPIQLTSDHIQNKRIILDDWIYQVLGVLRVGSNYNQFNLEYTAFMTNIGASITPGYSYNNMGLLSYTISESYLSLVNDFFNRESRIHYSQTHNNLYFYSPINLKENDYLILEVYKFSDPDTYRKTWNNWWLRDYTTALFKKQWGQNMLKYDGFQLPSGITLNGRAIFEDAKIEIEELLGKLNSELTLPVDFFVG